MLEEGYPILLEANDSTPEGQVMQSQEWREASSTSPRVDEGLCSIPVNSGFTSADDSDWLTHQGCLLVLFPSKTER